jgi:mannose/fructose/N-acetylgalactosamine-specific phosphotransferase system component IIC
MNFPYVYLGYILVTLGVFMLYLLLFRKDRLPVLFSKWWFFAFIFIASIAVTILGWLLATRVIG